ncbi:MAG: hypothetical protein D6736_20315 [Nitrospinota bacterium]|nr:MAG: hypothetical protein D6736_20315 [Nitrospinota bacterium]
MKCPKCGYVSFEYLDTCQNCHTDLSALKESMGLFAIKPGEIDLAMVLEEEMAVESPAGEEGMEEGRSVPTHTLAAEESLEDLSLSEKDLGSAEEEEETVPTIALDEEEDLSLDLSQLAAEATEEGPPAPQPAAGESDHLIGLGDLADLGSETSSSPADTGSTADSTPVEEETEHLIDLGELADLGIEEPSAASETPATGSPSDIPGIDFLPEELLTPEEERPDGKKEDSTGTAISAEGEESEPPEVEEIDFDLDLDLGWEEEGGEEEDRQE